MLYALFVLTTVCLLALCLIPRALAPLEPPALVLDRGQVAQVVREDAKAASSAPQSAVAKDLVERFLVLGDVENHVNKDVPNPQYQRDSIARTFQKLTKEAGEEAALKLRSAAVEKLEAALRLRLAQAETDRVLGLFPDALAHHRVTYDGYEVAPHFVLRTLYKARWNIAMGLPPDYKLAPVELEAYHGWLALHASNLSPEPRALALNAYANAGGKSVAEARGVLAFLAHDYDKSVKALEQAERESPSLRLRNWLRGAHVALAAVNGEE